MNYIKITAEKIEVEKILPALQSPECGAISLFIGTTKNFCDGKNVETLEYEAYEKMALKEMNKICTNMKKRWPLHNVTLVHRIGSVPVGEVSVVIGATSVHRKEAQESVMYGIDAVKAEVPIWKKEQYTDGSTNWKVNDECRWRNCN